MKAQSTIIEQVLLFAISVVIFIMCFAVFMGYQDYFLSIGINDQLENTRNLIALNIIRLSEKGLADSSITIPISKNAGNEPYKIELSENGLNVTSLFSGVSKVSSLYGLGESFGFDGKAVSTAGRVVIYKKENEIRLI